MQGSVTVVDINPAMLDEGRKKAASTSDLAGGCSCSSVALGAW